MGKCFNSITVAAPPQTVWKRIRNFHDMSWAGEVVTSCTNAGSVKGDQVGARRIINQAFHETLLSLDDAGRTMTYSIDDGPPPVAKQFVKKYVGAVKVLPGKDQGSALVEWSSEFQSSKDKEVEDFCNPIYGALLQGLKKHFSA